MLSGKTPGQFPAPLVLGEFGFLAVQIAAVSFASSAPASTGGA